MTKAQQILSKLKFRFVGQKSTFDHLFGNREVEFTDVNVIISEQGLDNYRPIFVKQVNMVKTEKELIKPLRDLYDHLAFSKLYVSGYKGLITDLKEMKINRYDALHQVLKYYLSDDINLMKTTDYVIFKKMMSEIFDDLLLGKEIFLKTYKTKFAK
ncbi:hypothetical protein [Serratia marcescens]|uniref:hypothetical protein n=1 Tax=Serratia marcescens TaxID=615 RepID=UPI001F149EAB|nr:hypothetical protein [Serratia marcescens]MDP8728351.1 hypothetical protein [Serratia marcescens]